MGAIIRMNSKTFKNDFLKEIENHEEFNIIPISENITTKGKYPNVKAIPRLMPPPNVVGAFINQGNKAYKEAYLQYLKNPQIEAFLSIMVTGAIKENLKVVLICSKSEDDFKYLELICEYIEAIYGMPTYTWKEYKKNPEKCNTIKNVDKIAAVLKKKFKVMEEEDVTFEEKTNKQRLEKELKSLSQKELRKIAKSKKIKLNDDMDKKDIIKKIIKKIA